MRGRVLSACWLAGLTAACTAPLDARDAPMPAGSTGAPSPPAVEARGACFGDLPPQVVASGPRPRDLFATGREVLWWSGGAMHRMDATTGRVSTIDGAGFMFVHAADARTVFGSDGRLNLIAIDLATGQSRQVASSNAWPVGSRTRPLPGVVTMMSAEYELDDEYVYVGWRPDPATYGYFSQGDHVRRVKGPHDLGDFGRVRRDGTAPPEYLGRGPSERFVLADGYAYWGSRFEGIKRRALAPGAANEVVWSAPDLPFAWMLGVSKGRVYFSVLNPGAPRTYAIESVPVVPQAGDAGAPDLHVHVASAAISFAGGVLDGDCVYAGDSSGVARANLATGQVRPIIEGKPVPGDATVFYSRFLAIDGQALYWADYGGDRVVQWRR